MDYFAELSRPMTGQLLETIRLNKVYHKADGNFLFYYDKEGVEIKVDDFVGGYGANILGHNNPEIVELATKCLRDKVPVHAQLSTRKEAGILAKILYDELLEKTGEEYICTLANTGTEGVEAALKHALISLALKLQKFFDNFHVLASNSRNMSNKFEGTFQTELMGKSFSSIEKALDFLKKYNLAQLSKNTPEFLALKGSFHGKTLGSLNLTHRKDFRVPFLGNSTKTLFLDPNLEAIENAVAAGSFDLILPRFSKSQGITVKRVPFNRYIAFFLEPIQGEGGVHCLSKEMLLKAREICDQHKIALVFDEIQSGFFRTGDFLASYRTGVVADYYVIGKSLGGSLCKLSAFLVKKKLYEREFGFLHTSTFTEDEFSCKIAAKAFELANTNKDEIKEKGKYIKDRLIDLMHKYPDVVTDVRGEGLMLGIEFTDVNYCSNYGFQILSRSGYLGYVISGFMLNNYNVRVAATLSTGFTIRIQPSYLVEYEAVDRMMKGFDYLCEILKNHDLFMLLRYLFDEKDQQIRDKTCDFRQPYVEMDDITGVESNVGFLSHYISTKSIVEADPSMTGLSDETHVYLLETILEVATPTVLGRKIITGITGKKTAITFIGLPFTSAMCKNAFITKDTFHYRRLCNEGVQLAKRESNVSVIGLGQYTSIITTNGRLIKDSEVAITTGNSYTAHLGLMAIYDACSRKNINLTVETAGVVGAAGNISSVYAHCLADRCKNLILFGSDSAEGREKCRRVAGAIYAELLRGVLKNEDGKHEGMSALLVKTELFKLVKAEPELLDNKLFIDFVDKVMGVDQPITIATDLDQLKKCRIVVCATSAPKAFLMPDHFVENTVICDISVPMNCTEELIKNNKNIEVILGGIAALPNKENIPLKGFPLQKGNSFACISETILMGLENYNEHFSFGNISKEQVSKIGLIGDKHGFKLGTTKKDLSY